MRGFHESRIGLGRGTMCGICGEVFEDHERHGDAALLHSMISLLRRRGPDSDGVRTGPGYGLGAARLAIVDLGPRADQPLASEDGSLLLVFNGEIYNHAALRSRLEEKGHRFRSLCDAEVVIHLFEEEKEACLHRLKGMFAFALYDSREKLLFAARDRFGQKPFFYTAAPASGAGSRASGETFLFASEIKALLLHPGCRAAPDRDAIDDYLSLGYVPGEGTAFSGIKRLLPAHYLLWKEGRLSLRRYWRLEGAGAEGKEPGRSGGELARELLERLREAVLLRLGGDVPLGVLLSGGVDSSAVAFLAAGAGGRSPLRTFSIGFDEEEYDETPRAARLASMIGSQHEELHVGPADASLLPRLVRSLEEPFADSSALATFRAAELARRSVKVVLTGDGGDEAFAGYRRYGAARLAEAAAFLPSSLRLAAAKAALKGLAFLPGVGPAARAEARRFLDHAAEPALERYFHWMSLFTPEEKESILAKEFLAEGRTRRGTLRADGVVPSCFAAAWRAAADSSLTDRLLAVDRASYLPGDLLVKMDRMTMACSLEARSPFLDHELARFAAGIPPDLKLEGFFGTKAVLKKALEDVLPPFVLKGKKKGFKVPIDRWFRGELRDFTGDILLGRRARERGIVNPEGAAALLEAHARGRAPAHHKIFGLLMLELWFREFVDGAGGSDQWGKHA